MASFLPDTDSEDELPIGWEERATPEGQVYYANHANETTQWTHPKTGKRKKLAGELPFGWERTVEPDGTILFIDHMSKRTTFTDPRLAFAVEEKDDAGDLRQLFDSSSTALQVLHGKDLKGKVAVVTGGNSGIGFETCRALALHGAHVIMACRNMDHARQQVEKIVAERSQAKVTAMHVDLSCLESVRSFAQELESLDTPIHMLILNAGVFALPHEVTRDGFERTFQVNHLSHFLLVRLLEKRLLTSAPCRVIVLSSESHRQSFLTKENISPEYLSPPTSSRFVPLMAYNDSKLCNVLFASQLNKRLSRHNVFSNSLHPGNMVSTGISRNWWFYRLLFAVVRPFTKSPEQGAATSVYVAVDRDLESVGGLYFNNCCRCTPSQSAQDADLAHKLWTLSEDMLAAWT